jgi:hypothetical protein
MPPATLEQVGERLVEKCDLIRQKHHQTLILRDAAEAGTRGRGRPHQILNTHGFFKNNLSPKELNLLILNQPPPTRRIK